MSPSPRLTLAALTTPITFFAVTYAALRISSPYCVSAMLSLSTLALLGSVVMSLLGQHRVGWSSFAILAGATFS